MKVCLTEDDLELGRAVQAALVEAGHAVVWVRRAQETRRLLDDPRIDALLLDLGLPDGDGLDLLRELRRERPLLAVLITTARGGLDERLRGLNLGADDYLTKPYAVLELLARLEAVARRAIGSSDHGLWKSGNLVLDEHRMLVRRGDQTVHLTQCEFALLLALLRRASRVVTRRELEAQALSTAESQSLDVHISNLRRKIGTDCIRTIRGVGYAIDP